MGKLKLSKKKKTDRPGSFLKDKIYKLLVIDDEEYVHQITKMALKSMDFAGFEVEKR